MIREDFLQQNSYDEVDVYTSLKKQYGMLKVIIHFYDNALIALQRDVPYDKIASVKEKHTISLLKRQKEDEASKTISELMKSLDTAFLK